MANETTETLDKTYLEWSQFTTARTSRELDAIKVLLGLRSAVHPDYDPTCWCTFPSNAFKTGQHEAKCQRARTLMEKLRVQEVR